MAVHNEEKILEKSLAHLDNILYNNYEVIIGLDGCTDKSEEIVKKFAKKSKIKFKYFKLNLRQGKPAVIDAIIKKAHGEIIFINDADWLYQIKSKEDMQELLEVFKNKNIGGIAESFPLEWHKDRLENSNLGYKIEAWSTFFWYNFQKKKFTYKKNKGSKISYVKEPTMFLTNIFRKKLYNPNFSLGDDFERTKNITKQNYEVVLFDNPNLPRLKPIYNKLSIKDLFKSKIRTAIAREQLIEGQVFNLTLMNYYIPATWYIFKEGWRNGIKVGLMMSAWIGINGFASVIAKFKKIDTREGWAIRNER